MVRVRINLEQHTMHQHEVNETTTRIADQGKVWLPNTPGAREAEYNIQRQTPTPENNTQGLGEQMHIGNKAALRCPQ